MQSQQHKSHHWFCTQIQVYIYSSPVRSLTIMPTTRNIKKCSRGCSIRHKNKHICHIVIGFPAIIKPLELIDKEIFAVTFQSIHCSPDIFEDWIFCVYCCFKLGNLFFQWNSKWCMRIQFQNMDHDTSTKMQIHTQIGHCHTKNQLKVHHRTPSFGPSKN